MEKIASFQIDHLRLLRGLYVSRRDQFDGAVITTFDWRWKEPNKEPVLDVPASHTLEHLGATWLRSHPVWKDQTVYFGPMGCRTGFYWVVAGEHSSTELALTLQEFLHWVLVQREPVPGASAIECGNWRDHNLEMAQWEARKLLHETWSQLSQANLTYPS